MDIFTILIWIGTLIFLGISISKDKEKTKKALRGQDEGEEWAIKAAAQRSPLACLKTPRDANRQKEGRKIKRNQGNKIKRAG